MTVTIFSSRSSTHEDSLRANPDGTVTYHWETDGWAMKDSGLNASDTVLSAEQAKARWPEYASKIDAAIAKASGKSNSN